MLQTEMNENSRPTIHEYLEQLQKSTQNSVFKSRSFYDTYMNGLADDIKNRTFSQLVSHLSQSRERYASPQYLFLTDPSAILLSYKPLDSVCNKLYRLNVLRPRRWPPSDGTQSATLDNFHSALDDVFRSRFICRYLDGPKFSCECLAEKCSENGVPFSFWSSNGSVAQIHF